MLQNTFIIIKPDAIGRGVAGNIISRFEAKGLQLVAAKLQHLTEAKLKEHYSHLADKSFFPRIVDFMSATPVLLMVWRGVDAVNVVRQLCGPTNGREAAPGTIRGDLSQSIQCNVVHASDGGDSAKDEIARFFSASEVFEYELPQENFMYGGDEK